MGHDSIPKRKRPQAEPMTTGPNGERRPVSSIACAVTVAKLATRQITEDELKAAAQSGRRTKVT